jgi:hypothetical protein
MTPAERAARVCPCPGLNWLCKFDPCKACRGQRAAVAREIAEAEEAVRRKYMQKLADMAANMVPALDVLEAEDRARAEERERVLRLLSAWSWTDGSGFDDWDSLLAAIESGASEL